MKDRDFILIFRVIRTEIISQTIYKVKKVKKRERREPD